MSLCNSFCHQDRPTASMPSSTEQQPRAFTTNNNGEDDDSNVPHLPKYIHARKEAYNYNRNGTPKKPQQRRTPPGRTIVICLDGTGDQFDADNSNIVEFVTCLKKDSPRQLIYYQTGIGTYDGTGLQGGISASLDMAVGSGLGTHVKDGYRFLMQTYQEGDKICLFGFSRGSYTARCLAGMLHKVGLLPKNNGAQVPFAYRFYKDDSPTGWQMSRDFKKAFCVDINVYFMGLFDCVASVGLIPRKLPLESSTSASKTGHFRHAIALDEHRAKFKVCRWSQAPRPLRAKLQGKVGKDARKSKGQEKHGKQNGAGQNGSADKTNGFRSHLPHVYDPYAQTGQTNEAQSTGKPTDVEEVWVCPVSVLPVLIACFMADLLPQFLGAHADVGGGAVHNSTRHKLSRIPLRWMIRQTFHCNTGITFSTAALAETGLDVHTLWPICKKLPRPQVGPAEEMIDKYKSGQLEPLNWRSNALAPMQRRDARGQQTDPYQRQGIDDSDTDSDDELYALKGSWTKEQEEDYMDSLAEINDQLAVAKSWWVLECMPIKARVQDEQDGDTWRKKVVMNKGMYRPVREMEPRMHWTVEQRMKERGYEVKTRVSPSAKWQVVS